MTPRYRIRKEGDDTEPIYLVDAYVCMAYGNKIWQAICAHTCKENAEQFIKGETVKEPKLTEQQQLLLNFICETFGVSTCSVLSVRRTIKETLPRQVFMYYCSKALCMTSVQIGVSIRRDHATVLHAVKKIEAMDDREYHDRLTIIDAFCAKYFKKERDKPLPFNFWEENIDESKSRPINASRASMRRPAAERASV